MKIKNKIVISLYMGLFILLIIKCNNPPTSGPDSQTSKTITGVLYNEDGSKAANAKVLAVPTDHNPGPGPKAYIIDSTITDNNGEYSFDSLPTGYYNILGYLTNLSSYNDSNYVPGDTITNISPDTIRYPGSLSGVIKLQPGDNAKTIFVLIFGTQTWTTPADSIGNFILASMAEGTYHVRFLTTLDDYDPLDVNLTIKAGIDDTLSDTLYMPFTGIPIPAGLTLSYDTLMQVVTLTWNQVDTSLVKGYNVYRKHSDSDFVKINPAPTPDTVYLDSTAIEGQSYDYKIRAVDKNDEEGKFSKAVHVNVVSAFALIDSFSIVPEMVPGALAIGNDSIIYLLDIFELLVKVFSTQGVIINEFGQGMFILPNDISLDSKGNVYVADPKMGKIVKFSKNGDLLTEFPLNTPSLVSIDKDDNIYAVYSHDGTTDNMLAKFDTSWNRIDSIVFNNSQIGYLLVAPSGNIFIGDKEDSTIEEYDSDFSLINSWNVPAQLDSNTLMAVDQSDNLYLKNITQVGLTLLYDIHIYSSSASKIARFGHFYPSIDIFTHMFNNSIYIAESLQNRRTKISIFSNPF